MITHMTPSSSASRLMPRTVLRRKWALYGICLLGISLFFSFSGTTPLVGGSSRKTTAQSSREELGFLPTRVLAHVPGYTVLENAYWQDGLVKLYSEEPWSLPAVEDIAQRDNITDRNKKIYDVEIIHVFDKPWSFNNLRKDFMGQHILLDEMQSLAATAEVIPGTTFATLDLEFLDHYYHYVELLYPMQKVFAKAREKFPSRNIKNWIDNLVFFHAEPGTVAPPGPRFWKWQDRAGVNKVLTEKAFPGIDISAKDVWIPRAESGMLYRFPILLLASRRAGAEGPNGAYKPFGDAFRLAISSTHWWDDMRSRLLAGHKCDYPAPKANKPVITYLSRQSSTRRLTDESHVALVEELQGIADTGMAEFRIEEFEDLPIPEQWARIARTTIFVAVHGNGLTHIIFMAATPKSAVYELQPENCMINDYSPLATSRNIWHRIVQKDHMCGPTDCGIRGCYKGDTINDPAIQVEAKIVGDDIRARLGIPLRP